MMVALFLKMPFMAKNSVNADDGAVVVIFAWVCFDLKSSLSLLRFYERKLQMFCTTIYRVAFFAPLIRFLPSFPHFVYSSSMQYFEKAISRFCDHS